MSESRRRIVRRPDCARWFEQIEENDSRGRDAIAGFERVVSRHPEFGNPFPSSPTYRCLPFHTDDGSYLVIYTYDDETVVCLGVRRVPRSAY
jgi:hypothetical protein